MWALLLHHVVEGVWERLVAASLGRTDRIETRKDERWVPCQEPGTDGDRDRCIMIWNLSGELEEETLGYQASFICFVKNYKHMHAQLFCSVRTRALTVS